MSQAHPRPDSEDALEQAVMELFASELRWDEVVNAYTERVGSKNARGVDLGRETEQEVVLRRYLMPALERLNPGVPEEALSQAAEELSRERGVMSLAAANREVYGLLKEGVKVSVPDPAGGKVPVTVRVFLELARQKVLTKRVDERHPLERRSVLEVLTQDDGHLVKFGDRPDLRVVVRKPVSTYTPDGLKHHRLGQRQHGEGVF